MALYKRNQIWHTDFSVNGQRFRQSLDTTDWREAQRHEKELISQASAGKITPSTQLFARLSFMEASDRYLADRVAHVALRTNCTERERLKPLRNFFGATSVSRISADRVHEYVAKRTRERAANRTLNMELGVLRRILKRAKRWHILSEDIKLLPERHNVGRAMKHGEKVGLLMAAVLFQDIYDTR